MPEISVRIDPLEPLLFGDNRSARAGEDHALADQDPGPATLLGTVGARIAAALGAAGERGWGAAVPVLGPFERDLERLDPTRHTQLLGYALHDPDGQLWFPRPLHFLLDRVGPVDWVGLPGLRPVAEPAPGEEPGAFTSVSPALPCRLEAPTEAGPRRRPQEENGELWVAEELLGEILAGGTASDLHLGNRLRTPSAFFRPERRLGLAVSNRTLTAVPGQLFSRPYRRFATGCPPTGGYRSAGYTAWLAVRSLPPAGVATWDGVGLLGGDRRRAQLTFEGLAHRPLTGLLDRVTGATAPSAGFLAYLLTPAVVTAAGAPGFAGRRPVAVATGRPQWASGWQAAARRQGPRPIRALLPAGSVLFFRWEGQEASDASARATFLRTHWLAACDGPWGPSGHGRALLGVWR